MSPPSDVPKTLINHILQPTIPLSQHHRSAQLPQLTHHTPPSICDLQEKFRPAIHEYPSVLAITRKLLRASKILDIPILATTQNRARLGETCAELGLDNGPDSDAAPATSTNGDEATETYKTLAHVDKTAFSMLVPAVVTAITNLEKELHGTEKLDCIVIGIETHICVLQTSLDLLARGHRVYVVQDAVSSCNKEERPVALERLRREGVRVTTSESLIYEILGDAGDKA